ncbi:MAG TPA: hypothetical protein VKX28_05135 [Xanthobacteraceae bacterium]|nr:hypothetical protein [Xanthobacteraceae bacterium]
MSHAHTITAEEAKGRHPVFAITFGVVFCVFYLFVMNYGWQLFTYYPATNEFVLFNHPPGPGAGAAMKWYGYVATSLIVSTLAGLVASLLPEHMLRRAWWPGLIWVVPIVTSVVLFYMIVYVGD